VETNRENEQTACFEKEFQQLTDATAVVQKLDVYAPLRNLSDSSELFESNPEFLDTNNALGLCDTLTACLVNIFSA